MRWQLYAIAAGLCGGCQHSAAPSHPAVAVNQTAAASASSIKPGTPERGTVESDPSCGGGESVAVFADGSEHGRVCKTDAAARGLTVIDLADDWTPAVMAQQPDGRTPAYHTTYVSLANEQILPGSDPEDALGELYGIVPTLSVVRARLADTKRHACWTAIDPTAIGTLTKPYGQDHKLVVQSALYRWKALTAQLEAARKKRGVADIAALADVPAYKAQVAKWKPLDDLHRGILAAQARLDCEDFLIDEKVPGTFTWRTGAAVELFQRRNFLIPNSRLDSETREALMLDSRELDFRLALRILRERVVDATGLIEDGTAADGPGAVLGRMLDPENMRGARGHEAPLPNGAGDLIHPATEAAAKALGWTDPDAVAAFLVAHTGGYEVAVALPAVPAYHAAHMELEAVIDRGDVWYDETPKHRTVKHRPTLVLYSIEGDVRRPLVRWPTTIGGWADQRLPGGDVVQKWKESDVGPRVWRQLYAGPTWTPPPTTPDRDLVRNLYNGHWRLKTESFGPGAHSAYGLVMLINNIEKKTGNTVDYDDNGIRTHGSSTVTSIFNGTSHGCHRLYNQLAVRLGGFLLRHRTHVVQGEQAISYRRAVHYKGDYEARVDSKGFLYELTPPVPVRVTKGNILSKRKIPPTNSAPARP
jgi:hypothetical protein